MPRKRTLPVTAPAAELSTTLQSMPESWDGDLPPGLEHLQRLKPRAWLARLIKVPETIDAQEAMAGFLSGIGLDLGVQVPEWARQASRLFMASVGFAMPSPLADAKPGEIGRLFGIWEQVAQSPTDAIPDAAASQMAPLMEVMRAEAAKASPAISKQFFDGRAAAPSLEERLTNLPQRAKVYLAVSALWRTVAGLNSAGELHRWLLEKEFILPATDPADTRSVCRSIGLRFSGRPGRPSRRK